MKILYVTDLHGDKEKYKKTLEIAIEKQIDVIVNGEICCQSSVTDTWNSQSLLNNF